MMEELRQLVGLENPEATPIELLQAFGDYLEEEGVSVDADGPLFILGCEGQNNDGHFIVEVAGLSWGLVDGSRRLHLNHGYALQDEEPSDGPRGDYEAGELLKMGPEAIGDVPYLFLGQDWLPQALVESSLELIERLARAARLEAENLGDMRKKLVGALLVD